MRVWMPGIMHGLLQTEDYAHALLKTSPGATDEMVASRLRSRMQRQRRVLMRDEPPDVWFIVDQMALYRLVGSAETMSGQMRHLLSVAARTNVTLQVLPAVAHPANASEFIVTDSAAYTEPRALAAVRERRQKSPRSSSAYIRLAAAMHQNARAGRRARPRAPDARPGPGPGPQASPPTRAQPEA